MLMDTRSVNKEKLGRIVVTPTRLYTAHSRALTTLYSDLESYASQQREVFIGTAGSVIERANAAGFRFYARQYYDGEGK